MNQDVIKSPIVLERSFGTHDGGFHADDVTACALLLHFDLIDRKNVIRSRDLSKLASCEFVCDVGGIYDPILKRFDHHQSDYTGSFSSAGMILQYLFEEEVIDESLDLFLRHNLIDGVDAVDTGAYQPPMGLATYSQVIAAFMPPEYDAEEAALFRAFFHAVDFALGHLGRVLARYNQLQSSAAEVIASMKRGGPCLYFEKAMPWMEAFFAAGGEEHAAQFVMMPARDKWKLRGIPPSLRERMKVRIPLPIEWAGLLEPELKEVTGIQGAVFCHKERFVSIWETRADAEKALALVLRQ